MYLLVLNPHTINLKFMTICLYTISPLYLLQKITFLKNFVIIMSLLFLIDQVVLAFLNIFKSSKLLKTLLELQLKID